MWLSALVEGRAPRSSVQEILSCLQIHNPHHHLHHMYMYYNMYYNMYIHTVCT